MTRSIPKMLALCATGVLVGMFAPGCMPEGSDGDLGSFSGFAAEWARAWLAAWML